MLTSLALPRPIHNLEENKGIITVELPGVQDAERVRKLLQASAHLQFWEVYNISEISKNIEDADKALSQYLSGVTLIQLKQETTAQKIKLILQSFLPTTSACQCYSFYWPAAG